MPQRKKDPSTRARANKASTAATLTTKAVIDYHGETLATLRAEVDRRNADRPTAGHLPRSGSKATLVAALLADDDDAPRLPDRPAGWHELTLAWWADVWGSPMSQEWHDSDIHNLYAAAMHYDDVWTATTAAERQKADVALCKRLEPLGLTPYARRRLEWTIESASEAKDRGRQRREAGRPKPPPAGQQTGRKDPRAALHAVT